MLSSPPKFQYCGLTIVLSNANRFEKRELLQGTGAYFFMEECLKPHINIFQCDIRIIDDKRKLLPNTKVILLLGQRAFSQYTNRDESLDEARGSPYIINGIPCIASFNYQDAVDVRDYESKHNKELIENDEEEYEEARDSYISDKSRSQTARGNYRFWLKSDTKKAIRILENDGCIPEPSFTPIYHIYPSSNSIIEILQEERNKDLYIDIETDIETLDIRCFSFNFSNSKDIYCVPVLDINYLPAYEQIPQIFRALGKAFYNNTTVAHSGAVFDFFIFGYKYRIPVGKNLFDTLISAHRIYPTVEKSLGHQISLWTYLPYHKNESAYAYRTLTDFERLLQYCGKDVYTMKLVKEAQLEYAKNDPGLLASINQAMKSIRPYLIMSLLGMKFSEEERLAWIDKSDRLATQYMRIIRILTGENVEMLISNKKCTKYFNEMLGYDIVKRTKTGASSLAADALLKLKLKHDNPVIDFLIKYREKLKEAGTLNWKTWITQ